MAALYRNVESAINNTDKENIFAHYESGIVCKVDTPTKRPALRQLNERNTNGQRAVLQTITSPSKVQQQPERAHRKASVKLVQQFASNDTKSCSMFISLSSNKSEVPLPYAGNNVTPELEECFINAPIDSDDSEITPPRCHNPCPFLLSECSPEYSDSSSSPSCDVSFD